MDVDNRHIAEETYKILKPYLVSRVFKKGQLLWSEGDTNGLLVFLKSGKVKIYRLLPTGKAITLYVFDSGTVFGFMPFFDNSPYPAYAQTLENCQADVITRDRLREVIRNDPEVAIILMRHLAKRLRDAFDTIERLHSRGTDPKVASALLALLENEAVAKPNRMILSLPISAGEFAQSLGLTPETFSRSITHLVEKGILKRLQRNRFQLLNLDELQEIAKAVMY